MSVVKKMVQDVSPDTNKAFTPILYSTGCPNCKTLKEYLCGNNIQFIENNNIDEMLSLGFDKVPMLEIEHGKYLNYSEGIEWANNGGNK